MKKVLKFLVFGVFVFLGSCSDDVTSGKVNNNSSERVYWGEWGFSGVKCGYDPHGSGMATDYICVGFMGDCIDGSIISHDFSNGNKVKLKELNDSTISFVITNKNFPSFEDFSLLTENTSFVNQKEYLYNLYNNNVIISKNIELSSDICNEIFPDYSGEKIVISKGIYNISASNEFSLNYTIE